MNRVVLLRGAAALLGGSLLAFGVALAVTSYLPGPVGREQALLGVSTLVAVWPLVVLWILFAPTAGRAWKRAVVPLVFVAVLDALWWIL